MCGIVAGVAERSITPILIEGLRRLEYRGYDSAGVASITKQGIERTRAMGKLQALSDKLTDKASKGKTGIAHTRWATHGKPSEANAHPHISEQIALVHNGIIENHASIKAKLVEDGVTFSSETDSEVVVHLLAKTVADTNDFEQAFRDVIRQLEGAFAIAAIHQDEPESLMVARNGPPLVLGHGLGENFAASDIYALLPVTTSFTVLEDGDIAKVSRSDIAIWNHLAERVERKKIVSTQANDDANKQGYKHFMLKELYEQPDTILQTIEGRLGEDNVLPGTFGPQADDIFKDIKQVHILACGTSSYAGMVAKQWLEEIDIPAQLHIASEYRYQPVAMQPGTMAIGISQSGETADTLAALEYAKNKGAAAVLAICNAPESSLTRLADITLLTRAGREIGVASTKAFTAQLTALALLVAYLAPERGHGGPWVRGFIQGLRELPAIIKTLLNMEAQLDHWAEKLVHKNHALFLGRGLHYPIALEGALKLKELSYIHAEAYPAGELKHGPLALVDEHMPIVALAPKNNLKEKLISNLHEVEARGGELFILLGQDVNYTPQPDNVDRVHLIQMPKVDVDISPMMYTIPLQLLAYKVALLRGTDVDQPRNLAKSVTVE